MYEKFISYDKSLQILFGNSQAQHIVLTKPILF